jgi:hypothetical protein
VSITGCLADDAAVSTAPAGVPVGIEVGPCRFWTAGVSGDAPRVGGAEAAADRPGLADAAGVLG